MSTCRRLLEVITRQCLIYVRLNNTSLPNTAWSGAYNNLQQKQALIYYAIYVRAADGFLNVERSPDLHFVVSEEKRAFKRGNLLLQIW